MKNKNKKGFTLVELLVVIAILAILASVSVVGYIGFTEKARKSVDEQLCAQYNTILQATKVSNDDISMADFVRVIEENGIRANKFKTTSKSYKFAYDRIGAKCILLEEDGSIAFPKGYTTNNPLWGVMDNEMIIQKGIQCYAIDSSLKVNSKLNFKTEDKKTTGFEFDEYIFDLDHRLFTIDTVPPFNMKVFNGTATVNGASSSNVAKYGQYTNLETRIIDKSAAPQEGITIANSDSKFNGSLVNGTGEKSNEATLSDLELYNGKKDGKDVDYSITEEESKKLTDSGIDTLIIEDCVFENIHLKITKNLNLNVIVRNCKFYNNRDAYSFYAFPVNSVEFVNNELINTKRGISIELPKTSVEVRNNKFTIAALKTETHNERKDNAIQFTVSAADLDNYFTGDLPTTPEKTLTKRINITGNTVYKGQALITVHDSWISTAEINKNNNTDNIDSTKYNKLKGFVDDPDMFDISNNTLADGVAKVNSDPGLDTIDHGQPRFHVNEKEKYNYFVNKFIEAVK